MIERERERERLRERERDIKSERKRERKLLCDKRVLSNGESQACQVTLPF